MVKWTDVNLNWNDVKSLKVEVASGGGRRSIYINGHKYTHTELRKNKPSSFGGTRMHLFGLDFVIKVDSPALYRENYMDTDRKQSNSEFKLWNNIEPNDRKYFAEVIAYEKNRYIVFRRYAEIDDINQPKQKIALKHIRKIDDLINKYDIADVETEIWKKTVETHNWGMVNGQPLIFDYGFADDY